MLKWATDVEFCDEVTGFRNGFLSVGVQYAAFIPLMDETQFSCECVVIAS